MKVIIKGKKLPIRTQTVGISLDLKTHEKLNNYLLAAKKKDVHISKQQICKLIIEANIDDVVIE